VDGLPASAADDVYDIQSAFVFHNTFHLTQVRDASAFDSARIYPESQKWVHFGRPDIPGMFKDLNELCTREKITRVAVCVCGPPALVHTVQDLCRITQMKPGMSEVRFDCHHELFDF
jgi:hypothetical protein